LPQKLGIDTLRKAVHVGRNVKLEVDLESLLVLGKEVVVLMDVDTGRDVLGPVGFDVELEADVEVLPEVGKEVVVVAVFDPERDVLSPMESNVELEAVHEVLLPADR
jgi:hypothetical protein